MTVKCSLLEAHKTYTVGPLHRPRLFFPFIDQHKQCPRVYYIQYICIYCTYLYIYKDTQTHSILTNSFIFGEIQLDLRLRSCSFILPVWYTKYCIICMSSFLIKIYGRGLGGEIEFFFVLSKWEFFFLRILTFFSELSFLEIWLLSLKSEPGFVLSVRFEKKGRNSECSDSSFLLRVRIPSKKSQNSFFLFDLKKSPNSVKKGWLFKVVFFFFLQWP